MSIKALKESIEHWKRLEEGEPNYNETPHGDNCPLCQLYDEESDDCFGCPIREKTKQDQCAGTPWRVAFKAWLYASTDWREKAKAMRVWLEDLLEELEDRRK